MGMWADVAKQTIERVHSELPATATLAERKDALRAAYPFGEREYSPYKTWCKKQREYLRRFEPMTEKTAPLFVSPKEQPDHCDFDQRLDAMIRSCTETEKD